MEFRRTKALLLASVMAVSSVVIAVPASADVGTWSDNGNGTYSYTQGSDNTAGVENFYLDLSGVENWTAINYISIDVEATATAQPVIGASYGEDDWRNGNSVWMQDGGNATVYFEINGEKPESVDFMLWSINDTTTLEAGTEVTISNITFSTEEMPDPVGAWFEKDGAWYYQNGDTAKDYEGLDLMQMASDASVDWSTVKYISATVETEGTLCTAIDVNYTGGDDDWEDSATRYAENGSITVYFNTDGKTPHNANVSIRSNDEGVALAPNQLVKVSNIIFSTEERDMTGVTGEWYKKDGKWHYTHGDDTTLNPAGLNLMSLKPEDISWADIKYVSADVTTDNASVFAIGGNLTGNENDWTNGTGKTLTAAGTATANLDTNGAEPTMLEVQFWHVDWDNNFAIAAGTNITVSNIVFSTEERDMTGVTGEWYEKDGAYHYKHGDDSSVSVTEFEFDLSSVEDWSKIKYISADVDATATTQPAICGDYGTDDWREGTPVWMQDGGTSTVYFECQGDEPQRIVMQFWTETTDAGTELTISNIVFSTEERDMTDVTDEWYEKDGKWYYTHGNNTQNAPRSLDLHSLKPEDVAWEDIKYISVDVTSDKTTTPAICPNFDGGDDNWIDGNGKQIDGEGTVTVFFDLNGREAQGLELRFWHVDWDNNFGIEAGANITVSNIVFSTEERDYSDVYNEWYEQNGKWYYRTGDEGASDAWFDLAPFKPENTAYADIKYISADITVDGKASPLIIANDWALCSKGSRIEDVTTTLYLDTYGKELSDIALQFWWYEDPESSIAANTLITLSNVNFSTEPRDYSNVYNEWYELDGKWYYRTGDEGASDTWFGITFLKPDNTAWTDIEYISADITVDGKANPVLTANEGAVSGTPKLTEDATTTIYLNTFGKEFNDIALTFWWYDDSELAITANSLVTLSNVKFSTEPRDYSKVFDEWYQIDETTFEYKAGTSDIEDPADISFNDVMDVDMTGVKYFTADITVDGTMEGALIAYSDENDRTKVGQGHTITDESKTIYMFCYESGWSNSRFDLWNIEAGTKVTVSNVKFYTEYITDYRGIVGQWVQTGDDDYYYNHGDLPEGGVPGGLPLTYDGYDASNIQTVSMKLKHVLGDKAEAWYSAKVHVTGEVTEGYHPGYTFISASNEQTIVRKYRGMLQLNPMLESSWVNSYVEIYITDLTFGTEEVPVATSTPNDVVIDDNETSFGDSEGNWAGGYNVMWFDLAKIEVEGTLKFDAELTDNAINEHRVHAVWNDWSENGSYTEIFGSDGIKITESSTIEIPITADTLKMIHETASHECELGISGTGYKVSNFIFTPKTDAPEPEVEEFKPETLPEEEKKEFEEKLEQSKENTVDEKDAKDKVHDGKPQGHKKYKKDKHGRDVYSLRIVKMVDKELLKHAKDVSITVYSKKADQYVTFTAECCFSYLNINGEKVKAGGKHAFLTVIIDNVHADDEITFTDFTINYKK